MNASDGVRFNTVALGRAVACRRLERGMTRRDLVAACGVSYPYLAQIETGDADPTLHILARLAQALGITVSALIGTAETIAADPRNWLSE